MKEQTIIVFGGGTGCGQAISMAIARSGARVIVSGRRPEPIEQTAKAIGVEGGQALAQVCDIRSEESVGSVVGHVIKTFGRVHAIVNSAGANVPRRSVETQTIADWNDIIATNLLGPAMTVRAVLPHMLASGGGTIVNLGSITALDAYLIAGPAYTASKHGLRAFTKYINAEYRAKGVRACHLAFGETETPLRHSSRPKTEGPHAPLLETSDVAACVMQMLTAHPRAVVEEVVLQPTVLAPFLSYGLPPWMDPKAK